jgi:hypothetical protein
MNIIYSYLAFKVRSDGPFVLTSILSGSQTRTEKDISGSITRINLGCLLTVFLK